MKYKKEEKELKKKQKKNAHTYSYTRIRTHTQKTWENYTVQNITSKNLEKARRSILDKTHCIV